MDDGVALVMTIFHILFAYCPDSRRCDPQRRVMALRDGLVTPSVNTDAKFLFKILVIKRRRGNKAEEEE